MRFLCKPTLSLLLLLLVTTASAQMRLPTGIELRAAYCVEVLQNDIAEINEMQASVDHEIKHIEDVPPDERQTVTQALREGQSGLPKDVAERQSTLNRLQLFIVPRMKYLDANALLGANERAKSDLHDFAALVHRCSAQCRGPTAGHTSGNMMVSCIQKCTSGALIDRLNACRNPTWLPF